MVICTRQWLRSISIAGLLVALAACGTTKADHAKSYADSGIALTATIPDLVDQAFAFTLKVDTKELIDARSALTQNERLAELEKSDRLMTERLEILRDFKRHSLVLKNYFIELQSLATSDAPAEAGKATSSLVQEAAGISESVKSTVAGKQIGGKTLAEFIPAAVEFTVGAVRAQALQASLKETAPVMERELAFTEAFLAMLAEIADGEFATLQTATDTQEIQLPYARDGVLPTDWEQRRLQSYKARLEYAALDHAREAANLLRINFIQLSQGRLNLSGVSELIQQVSTVVALFEKPGAKGS